MSDVLKATYADLKTVKTRSTCQLILELPIEALTDVVGLLGAPVPGNEVWVAVARLKPEATNVVQIEDHRPPVDGIDDEPHALRPLSQIAAMLCQNAIFQKFIEEKSEGWDHRPTKDEAADWLRSNCGVKSRTELNTNDVAARRFKEIRSGYEAWRLVG